MIVFPNHRHCSHCGDQILWGSLGPVQYHDCKQEQPTQPIPSPAPAAGDESARLGPCPHCNAVLDLARTPNHNKAGIPLEWRAECQCGYCSPFSADAAEAVRWHNKMSQMCGAR